MVCQDAADGLTEFGKPDRVGAEDVFDSQVEAAVSVDAVARLYGEKGDFAEAITGLYPTVIAFGLSKKQLAEYELPPMDVAVDEAVLDYVNRRKASFADSNI